MKASQKIAIVIAILLAVIAGGFKLYMLTKFRIVHTDPSTSQVSTDTPYIKVSWNDTILSSSLRLDDTAGIVDHTGIKDKDLTIYLRHNMQVGGQYTIIISSIANTNGKVATNKKLSFTAKRLANVKLSDEQRNALVAQQDKPVYAVERLNYVNFNNLSSSGISNEQVASLKQELFNYSSLINKKFWTMTIGNGSITVVPYNPDTQQQGVSFSITLSNIVYKALVSFEQTSDDVHLTLVNPSGLIVYDSATATD